MSGRRGWIVTGRDWSTRRARFRRKSTVAAAVIRPDGQRPVATQHHQVEVAVSIDVGCDKAPKERLRPEVQRSSLSGKGDLNLAVGFAGFRHDVQATIAIEISLGLNR
jgi:hypothetical protein